jgi:hypothetical protein
VSNSADNATLLHGIGAHRLAEHEDMLQALRSAGSTSQERALGYRLLLQLDGSKLCMSAHLGSPLNALVKRIQATNGEPWQFFGHAGPEGQADIRIVAWYWLMLLPGLVTGPRMEVVEDIFFGQQPRSRPEAVLLTPRGESYLAAWNDYRLAAAASLRDIAND